MRSHQRRAPRRCTAPNCNGKLGSNPLQQFCSRPCKARAAYHRQPEFFRAAQQKWRDGHRAEAAQATRDWRDAHPGGANRAARAKAEERRLQRQVDHPNCTICGKRLTDKQRARGVTCSPRCATYRWRWFVRDAA